MVNEWSTYYKQFYSLIGYTSAVLKYTEILELTNKNPMELVIKPKPKEDNDGIQSPFYNKEELLEFLESLESVDDSQQQLLLYLLAYTRLRKGEHTKQVFGPPKTKKR